MGLQMHAKISNSDRLKKMKNIILNYDYNHYPFTTASYLDDAAKKIKGINCYRITEDYPAKPDLVINVMPFSEMFVIPGVPSCYWEIDDHMIRGHKPEYYAMVDHVYVAQSYFQELYPPKKTSYLPLACDPEKHHRIHGLKQKYDIGFLGNDTYPVRRLALEQLATKYKVLRSNSAPGLPYSTLLSQCKMTFNYSLDHDVNMRFFEAIAIGRLLLTDYLPEQDEFATVGKHYQTFQSWQELDGQVGYYLSHEEEREKIALAGSLHMMRQHTYEIRLRKILTDFHLLTNG
jgi:hypothetical protein